MTKRELWEAFIKTGSVKDYLKYKKAETGAMYDNDETLAELSQELYEDSTQKQD